MTERPNQSPTQSINLKRAALGPTLAMLPALGLLLGLGTWQLQRLAWKEALIAERQAGLALPPVDLADATDWRDLDGRRVQATGRFLHQGEALLESQNRRTLRSDETGVHVLTPFQLTTGDVVLVNRGFVPLSRRDPASRAEGQVSGEVRVSGLLRRPPAPNSFTPENDPKNWQWFRIDPQSVLTATSPVVLRPGAGTLYLQADETPNPGGLPIGQPVTADLPNNHLQYALTWYSLAGVLILVWGALVRSRLKAPPPSAPGS